MVNKNEAVMEITDQEFLKALNSNKLVVADFFADWCMPCLIIAPIMEDLAGKMKKVKFVKINVDDNQELTDKYEVRSIPTLIIFKDGKEADRIIGAQSEDKIEYNIKRLL